MILVCLGNTGKKYRNTRHNAGKKFGEFLCQKFEIRNSKSEKSGKIIELKNGWKVIFLNCLMNNAGSCLKSLLNFTNSQSLIINHYFVVHDDLDIPFGNFKIQHNRGAAGHKGVQSLIDALGTKKFGRIRIGIGRPPENIPSEKYVLMHFTKEEKEKLEEVFDEILKNLQKIGN